MAMNLPQVAPFRADLSDPRQVEAALVGASSVLAPHGERPRVRRTADDRDRRRRAPGSRSPGQTLRARRIGPFALGDVAESVRTENTIFAPIGDGRVPLIDTRDIAAVGAEVLLHGERHIGKKYRRSTREKCER
jgi:hypothetical protein